MRFYGLTFQIRMGFVLVLNFLYSAMLRELKGENLAWQT